MEHCTSDDLLKQDAIKYIVDSFNAENPIFKLNNTSIRKIHKLYKGKLSDNLSKFEDKLIVKMIKNTRLIHNKMPNLITFHFAIKTINKYFDKENNINLFITNKYTDLKLMSNINHNTKYSVLDVVLFKNPYYSSKLLADLYDDVKKDAKIIRKIFGNFNTHAELFNTEPLDKYNNVMCNFAHREDDPLSIYHKIGDIYLIIVKGLMNLLPKGNMYIELPNIYPIPSINQLLVILKQSFKHVEITSSPVGFNIVSIECFEYDNSYFKNDNDRLIQTIKNLKDSTKTPNIILCKFEGFDHGNNNLTNKLAFSCIDYYENMNYMYTQYMPLDEPKLNDLIVDKLYQNFKMYTGIMLDNNIVYSRDYVNLLYDFNDNFIGDILPLTNNIKFEILNYDTMNLRITKSKTKSKPKSHNKQNVISQSKEQADFADMFMDQSKELSVKSHRESLLSTLSNLSDSSDVTTSKTRKVSSKSNKGDEKKGIESLRNSSTYSYNELQHYFNRLEVVNERQKKHLRLNKDVYNKQVKEFVEDFKGGINHYLNKKFDMQHKLSNAYTKLWEILFTFKLLPNNKDTINTFHFAEAPGQFIWTTQRYIEKICTNVKQHSWYANSLNPFNEKVMKQYPSLFGDNYGLMKNNPKKWIWGEDNTGDITTKKNILWFKNKINQNKDIYDIVTGDGGLNSGSDITILQKLDYAQLCMTAACCSPNRHCVIKIFLPYITDAKQATESGGTYMGILYTYYLMFRELHLYKPYSSDPTSGEFYVIGKYFKGVPDNKLETMLNILDNFKLNQCIYPRDAIPEYFSSQIIKFIDVMSYYNTKAVERFTFFNDCMFSENDTKHCKDFLKPDNVDKIKKIRYEKWIAMFKFQ